MATEQPLPYDLHDSRDLGRFTHVASSTLTDSEHEVLVEADSDSDVPDLKARKDRSSWSLPVDGRKKGPDRKKKSLSSELHTDPVVSEDLLSQVMEQNKMLIHQNKVLMKRLEPSDPFPIVFPTDDAPMVYEPSPMPEIMHNPAVQAYPEPFPPDFAQPVKRKSKNATEDKLYAQCRGLWDVLPRVLRVIEAAAKPPNADGTVAKSYYDGPFDNYPDLSYLLIHDPSERESCASSKDRFVKELAEAERKFGISHKPKKLGKKVKAKTGNGKLKLFDKNDLVPWAWKALGLLQNFLLVFVMIQLSLVGGDVFHFFKKSPKNSSWLGF